MNKLFVNIAQLLPMDYGKPFLRGKEMNSLQVIENAYLYVEEDKIVDYGKMEDLHIEANQVIDCTNKLVTPGLVDPHTHLVFGGSREKEIALKLQGVSYLEILNMGMGIHSTVNATKLATKQELVDKANKAIKKMNSFGVTTIEAKSGYGLDEATELKQLEVLNEVIDTMNIKRTFLGAHAVPKNRKSSEYLQEMKDFLVKYKDSNLFDAVDIFCEDSVFNIAESEDYLRFAKDLGFDIHMHADEIVALGGAELAVRLEANSADHIIAASDEGIKALGNSNTVCSLLPGTSFYLNKDYAKARRMLDNNCIISLSTDYNPGSSPTENIQFIMNLALLKYKMTPREIWNAVTINPAYSLRIDRGTLRKGAKADIAIWDAPNYEYVVYHNASNDCEKLYKDGKLIWEA